MNPKQRLKKDCDKLAKERWLEDECFVCGMPANTLHHYIPKSQSLYLRWDKRNLISICPHCHTLHHRCGDPRIHQIILEKKGFKWADKLEIDRRKIFKDNLTNLREVRERLKNED